MSETEDYDKSATPTAHKISHQLGGSDEVNISGLAGGHWSLFEVDINGDCEPITETLYEQYFELDALNDVMPKAA